MPETCKRCRRKLHRLNVTGVCGSCLVADAELSRRQRINVERFEMARLPWFVWRGRVRCG